MFLNTLQVLLLVFAGHCFGALLFYFVHRFIFHGNLGKLPLLKLLRRIHTQHHAKPHNLEKAFFPNWSKPIIVLAMLIVGFANIYFAIGVSSFFPVYAYRHWKAHNGSKAYWARHHMTHHLKHPNKNFGGIYPIIDSLFRTNISVDTLNK